MSWTDELVRVYDKCIGNKDVSNRPAPIYFKQEDVQITISLNSDGTIPDSGFACVVSKGDELTLIPVTMDSVAKTGGNISRPFIEELQFVAKDYPEFGYVNTKKYEAYIKSLSDWVNSEYTNYAIQAVYKYISNASLIHDLIDVGLLSVDESTGKLLPAKINGTVLEKCKVRFRVDGVATWKDDAVTQSFTDYYSSKMEDGEICYASGKKCTPTYTHPCVLGTAKLFSYKEDGTFKYKGRFDNEIQAASISYNYSQKLHNALKYLISKQGMNVDGLCILVWENNLEEVPDITQRCFLDDDDDDFNIIAETEAPEGNTGEINKTLTMQSLMGVKNKYKDDSKTILMMLDSATLGRLSMTEYAELPTSDYIRNLEKWHRDTAWIYCGRQSSFSVYEIANCAYGKEQKKILSCDTNKEVKKEVFQRLLPCIAEGMRVPQDIVNALFIRACRPNSFEEKNWKRILNCACGMIRKRKIEKGGECSMALDKECYSRDYLYGRLLAVADVAEDSTYDNEESRTTNAKRFFEAFSNHPYQTWNVIYKSLRPYLNRMSKGKSVYYERMINDITAMFEVDDFRNNSLLSPEFLHAYSCQVNELYTKKTNVIKEEE